MKKIIVVDNEPDQIFTVKTCLESLNDELEIIGAESGKQCLEMLNNGEIPDLILSETIMQGMTGSELSNKLKENPIWKDIPLLFLTVWKDKYENKSDFSDNNHVEKPFDIMGLKTKIDTFMKKEQ